MPLILTTCQQATKWLGPRPICPLNLRTVRTHSMRLSDTWSSLWQNDIRLQGNFSMVHRTIPPQRSWSSLTPLIYLLRDTLQRRYITTTVSMRLQIRRYLPLIKVRALSLFSTAILTSLNYLVPPYAPYTPYLPHHHPQHRAHQLHPTPGPHSSSHSQAHPHSIGEIRSRWIALQTLAMSWPPDTIEPRDLSNESPLMAFVERIEGTYYCRVPVEDGCCDKENIKKDRILAHIRKEHLHFRPLACGGQCGLIGWLVVSPSVRRPDIS